MIAVWKREMQSYFYTPVGYVFMGVFLTLSSVIFFLQIMSQRSSDLLTFIGNMSYLWMLLCPVLTMRLLAEERQKATDQLLFTSPVSLIGVVLGKYLAAITLTLITVALTLVYVLVVMLYGQVFAGELLCGYLGFVLQGFAFIAVDLFVSGLCRAPVTAAILAFGLNFALWMMDLLVSAVPAQLGRALSFLSLYSRNEPFLMGQLSYASILYDVAVIIIFLASAICTLDARRYRGKGA